MHKLIKRFSGLIVLTLLPLGFLYGQDKIMNPSKTRSWDLRPGVEMGTTFSFQNRVTSEKGLITKGDPSADPYLGVTLQFRYKSIFIESGFARHLYYTTYGIKDTAGNHEVISQVYNDKSVYVQIPLRVSTQIKLGHKKKRFTLEPMIGVSFLMNKEKGFYVGDRSEGTSFSSSDTVRTFTEMAAYSMNNRMLVPAIGLKLNYKYKRSLFSIQTEYLWSMKDWRYVEVRYRRYSDLNGSNYEKGFIYSKVSCLSVSLNYKYIIFRY